jgi:uncharacterized protein (DUF924 family)
MTIRLKFPGEKQAAQNRKPDSLTLLPTFALVIALIWAPVGFGDVPQSAFETSRIEFLNDTDSLAMDILKFWFEEWDTDLVNGGKGRYNDKWFPHGLDGAEGSKETDEIIRQRFMSTFQLAVTNKLNWDIESNPYESLAYIILLDQFTRNMFRGTEQAYEYDNLSRAAAKVNIEQRFYLYYFTGYQKLFIVYPLMHHEHLPSQELSLKFLKAINEQPGHPYEFLNALQKGVEHYQVVFMFGRFPHRNVRRDRENTHLEAQYLSKNGTPGFVDGSKW